MWVILLIAFIEYAAISIFITIDPYASKGNKRGKRLVKMLIWLITAVVVNYLMKENGDYKIYLMIACFFAIKHFLEIINPYLEHMFFTATVYAVIVRRHIVGGTYRTLISVQNPLRLCRTGICRSLSAG